MLRQQYLEQLARRARQADTPGQEIIYRIYSELILKGWGPGALLQECEDMSQIEESISNSLKIMDTLDELEEQRAMAHLPTKAILELREKFVTTLLKVLDDQAPYGDRGVVTLSNPMPDEYTQTMTEVRKAIPHRVKVARHIIPVRYGPEQLITRAATGLYDRATKTIHLRALDYYTGKPRPLAEVYASFLHECAHCHDDLRYDNRLSKTGHAEEIITALVDETIQNMSGGEQ